MVASILEQKAHQPSIMNKFKSVSLETSNSSSIVVTSSSPGKTAAPTSSSQRSSQEPTTQMVNRDSIRAKCSRVAELVSGRCNTISNPVDISSAQSKSSSKASNPSTSGRGNPASSFHQKARRFLSLSSSSGSLRQSTSSSCLFAAAGSGSSGSQSAGSSSNMDEIDGASTSTSMSSSSLAVASPTRASLTHEWKKLKTPNKCRECNLFVYFNGRECSFCGFVAHKKCVSTLVIKCSGQQVRHSTFNTTMKGLEPTSRQPQSPASRGQKSLSSAGLVMTSSSNHQHSALGDTKDKNNNSSKTFYNNNINDNNNNYSYNYNYNYSNKIKRLVVRPIFGQPIRVDSYQIVDFIRRFVYEIDTRGLTSKGIYRVSSIKSKVDRLCNYYDQNLSYLIDLSCFHPNIIANALKMYLRQLPEPLLTHKLYDKFVEFAKKHSNSTPILAMSQCQSQSHSQSQCKSQATSSLYEPLIVAELREIVDLLPPINREVAGIIMRHLRRVADMSDHNQMSIKNLSIIFGPTLLNSNNKTLAIVDNIHQAHLVELMILWADQVFPQYANYESKAVIELSSSSTSSSSPSNNLNHDLISGDLENEQEAQFTTTQIPIIDVTNDDNLLIEQDHNNEYDKFKSSSTTISSPINNPKSRNTFQRKVNLCDLEWQPVNLSQQCKNLVTRSSLDIAN